MAVTTATSTPAPERKASLLRFWPHAVVALLVAAIAVALVLTSMLAGAVSAYKASALLLENDVKVARADGFTDADLRPVLNGLSALKAASPPQLGLRFNFYESQRTRADSLRSQLSDLRDIKLAAYHAQFESAVNAAKTSLDQANAAGVSSDDLAPLAKQVNDLAAKDVLEAKPGELRKLIGQAAPLAAQLDSLAGAQVAENAEVDKQVAVLKAAHPNDIEAIRREGQAALTSGRNDGTLAGWLKLHQLDRDVARIEAAAGPLGGGDLDQVARAAATIQVRNAGFHTQLAAAMPNKVIEVSIQDQHLYAFENGKQVFDTLVTTGRPQLPTDTGPMSVLHKDSPWKMHSPWPRSSRWWYPDTVVRKVLWFTATGEGLHDATWEPDWMYGPGSEFNQGIASHGCIHLPGKTVDWLYDWAPVGTPVIVIPGDGTPAASQLQHDTIDTPEGQTAPHGS